MIEAVRKVWTEEITQEMINKACNQGFFNRLDRIVQNEGGNADRKSRKRRDPFPLPEFEIPPTNRPRDA